MNEPSTLSQAQAALPGLSTKALRLLVELVDVLLEAKGVAVPSEPKEAPTPTA